MACPMRVITFWLLGVVPSTLFGFSVDGSSLTRAFDRKVVLTNGSIQVTATFLNATTNVFNGFYYTEQVPTALSVSTLSVLLNGRSITNFTLESGLDGDVYAGCTPWRWVLETPTNFAQANPAPPQATVQIVYSLSCSSTGTFTLQEFSWAARAGSSTNVFFAHSESPDVQLVKFVSSTNNPLVRGQTVTDRFTVWVDGIPGSLYLLAASTNLVTWTPVSTNRSPFVFVDDKVSSFRRRFYRALPFDNPWAPLAIARGQTNSFLLTISGVTDCSYILESSTNLLIWAPVLTNVCPFNYLERGTPQVPRRFYRARLLTVP
jgi:hypothetical protein